MGQQYDGASGSTGKQTHEASRSMEQKYGADAWNRSTGKQ
jgi:hypothetical protein